MWWWLAACAMDGSWSREEPGWDAEGCPCWEEPEPEEPMDCQRRLDLRVDGWAGDAGTFSGSWDAGPHGIGTVSASWTRVDGTYRLARGDWDASDGRVGTIEAWMWEGEQGSPEIWGMATDGVDVAFVQGQLPPPVDGTAAGEVSWSFAEAWMGGWFTDDALWIGRGLWGSEIVWAEGSFAPIGEDVGEIVGTFLHAASAYAVYGSYEVGEDGAGSLYLLVDRWGLFLGDVLSDGTFGATGFPEGC